MTQMETRLHQDMKEMESRLREDMKHLDGRVARLEHGQAMLEALRAAIARQNVA